MKRFSIGCLLAFLSFIHIEYAAGGYSAIEDARIIAQFKQQQERNHAKIARKLVHENNWASVGSISTNDKILGYPMVNIISVDDSNKAGKSTGLIHFLLTDLDFTGPDWRASNKVTFLYTDEQNKNCAKNDMDPMEPTCARTIISGKVRELKPHSKDYEEYLATFIKRHPAAENWIKAHTFYLCQLEIKNIFVLDYYGGPHSVSLKEYLNAEPNDEVA